MNNSQLRQLIADRFTEPVRDALWKHIYLSPGFKKLASTPAFINLGSIRQLGPTWFVYPAATHTRLNHSFGVFEIAKRMISAILRHPEAPQLTREGVMSFLAACLLHDTGHFPYAHSLKELPLREHEEITADLVLENPIRDIILNDIGGDPELTAAIVDCSRSHNEASELNFYRNILSGVLDPDKMDYLNRDAFFCGVPYGQQDIDYVIDRIVPDPLQGIAVDRRGVEAIDNILFSKYLMYKSVYWHKTVRIATAMIKKSILMGMRDDLIKPEDLYYLDDAQFANRFDKEHYQHGELVRMTHAREFYRTALEIPYANENKLHTRLSDIKNRLKIEAEIAREMGLPEDEVIIDIPEPIKFEAGLRIADEGEFKDAVQCGSVFNKPVIERFRRSLRVIRVLIPPGKELPASQQHNLEEQFGGNR